MKYIVLFFTALLTVLTCFSQVPYRIDNYNEPWEEGRDGYFSIDLLPSNRSLKAPEEINGLGYFSIFNVPFKTDTLNIGQFGTTIEGTEEITLSTPAGTTEILFVLFADFPKEELHRSWALETPLNVLYEPERLIIELQYSDNSIEQMLPVNADYNRYGITHGRALYSVCATKGKTISCMTFKDKMRNASFQIVAATANTRLLPRISPPDLGSWWYPAVTKCDESGANFIFSQARGLAWDRITSDMLPNDMQLNGQPVFILRLEGRILPSTEWNVIEKQRDGDTDIYTAIYQDNGKNLEARFSVKRTKSNAVELSLDLINKGKEEANSQLFFPVVSEMSIGSVSETWYAYARNGLIVNKDPCSYHDYLGSEKPIQFDGIFSPAAGVGLGIYPLDTTDVFRWYNFSKDHSGVNYALEYTPTTTKTGESWESIPVKFAVIPGDWKEQYSEYKSWLKTWYKKSTPVLPWFKDVFAFTYYDIEPEDGVDLLKGITEFKNRYGYVDYLHIFGWANTEEYGHWGDYNHFGSVGGKQKFRASIKHIQDKLNIPVGLYLDGYLMTDQAELLSKETKEKWAIKDEQGRFVRSYEAYNECLYVQEWRDYLISRYQYVKKELGVKGTYCDELGMSLRSRVCSDTSHGHPKNTYMLQGENMMMRDLKSTFPETAIYNEFGGTDVGTQFTDGGFSYITSWNYYSPEFFNTTGNVPYDQIAPQYLDLRRFTFPDMKTFDVILTQTPWQNGNWSLGKMPFFNGNAYFHRVDVGSDGDPEAVAMFKKIRELQNRYKKEFTSHNIEPLISTLTPNIFANRFSSEKRDVYTVFNANYKTVNGGHLEVSYQPGSLYTDVWNDKNIEILGVRDGKALLNIKMNPRAVICIVRDK